MNDILTPRLRLRRFRPTDAPIFVQYRNDPHLAEYQTWGAMDDVSAQAFIAATAIAPIHNPGGVQIAVALRENDVLIGDCYLRLQDNEQSEIGYTLARAYHGQGYASEAVAALLQFCFGELGLHRVIAQVACANARSVSLLARLGLRREGHFRQSFRYHGVWQDEYLYAILREEWRGGRG